MGVPRQLDFPKKLLILVVAGRLGVISLLLGGLTLIHFYFPSILPYQRSQHLYWIIIATYFLSLIYIGATARGFRTFMFLKIQIGIDILLATLVVLYSGGIDSPFTFLYPVIILATAVVFRERETHVTAACSLLTYGGIILGQVFLLPKGLFPFPPRFPFSGLYALYSFFLASLAFFLIAFLGGYLSSSLQKTGRELDKQRESLADLEALTSNIFNSLPSGVLTTNLKGQITAINPAGEKILGLEPAHVVELSVGKIFSNWSEITDYFEIPHPEPIRIEIPYLDPADGTKKLLGTTLSHLLNERGEQTGHLAIFQDLTPLRSMEEEVKKSQRLAALGELAAGLAHELRNPLAPIAGSVEMLREKVSPQDRPLLDIILRETERLNSLVSDFLQYARPLPLRLRRVDLDRLIADVLSLFNREQKENPEIKLSFSPGLKGSVMADPRMLRQVFWNLIKNSIEAVHPSGTIAVSTTPHKSKVKITITDTGQGIPQNQMDKIFAPFFTTKEDGTGLGLAITERILDLHQGNIRITSREGEGTTVVLLLPGFTTVDSESKEHRVSAIDPGR